ncbi:helix-turn-helix domain protein [Clostridium sp. CAG:307]|nr:helix-turn-helix domain protein [Clostridium sp. CAG:307]
MEDIRITLADNLTKLRKKHKLTQVEVAHQLGFSDKAISKWEQGDTIPDIETIKKIADLYGVTIDSLLEEVPIETESETKERKRIMTNKIIITLLAVTVVWTSSIVWFTIIKILNNYYFWQAFIWALPFSSIIILIFNSVWGNKRFTYLIVSVLLWTLCLSIHLQFLNYTLWLVYIIAIPAQIAIILSSQLTVKNKKH